MYFVIKIRVFKKFFIFARGKFISKCGPGGIRIIIDCYSN